MSVEIFICHVKWSKLKLQHNCSQRYCAVQHAQAYRPYVLSCPDAAPCAAVCSRIIKPHMAFSVPTGLCLAVLSHIFCARYSMFAAKLLTHMMAASLGTQVGELWNVQL